MRRLALLLAAIVLAGGAVVLVARRDRSAPFPSTAGLRTNGFAAWPVDTVEEAEAECAEAEDWRLDARATAERFAADVLRYPEPSAGEAFGDDVDSIRLLINTDGVDGVFLGSALQLERYGRCWYVTEGMPREDELGATLGFVYRDGRPNLLLSDPNDVPVGFVGYGDWATEIEPKLRQIVLWMPDLEPDATGHVVHTQPDAEGLSEIVGARSLGYVPSPPDGRPAQPLEVSDVVDDPRVCRIEAPRFRTPERVIRYLYAWTFDDLLRQVGGYSRYERKGYRHVGGDRWRLVVDDAVLIATIPEIAGRCYQLVSLEPVGKDRPLRRLWIDDLGVTFAVDWGGGDDASVGFPGGGGTLRQIREPVTFPRRASRLPADAPLYARVVLYKDGHVVSAYQGLFPPPP